MESHDLFIFKHVAEMRSISKTAEALGYVQPNISQRIKVLEEELGVKLLKRSNRGVTLTGDGERLLDYANRILLLMEEAKVTINPEKWQERLVIGATQTGSALRIPRILSAFLSGNKKLNVHVRTDTTTKLLEQVSYGEIDGAFVTESVESSDLSIVYSISERVSLISPLRHSDIENEHIFLVNSNPNCIYRKRLIEYAKDPSFNPLRIMEIDSLEGILQSVRDGLGISLVPFIAKNYHNDYTIKALAEPVQINFVIKKKLQPANGLKKFLQFLEEGKA